MLREEAQTRVSTHRTSKSQTWRLRRKKF